MRIGPDEREDWRQNESNSSFNLWLNQLVHDANGRLDLDALYRVAREHGITSGYRHLNPGHQRMIIGRLLRRVVPPHLYI